MRHLTWRGRIEVVLYALRRLLVAPAPPYERCFMGGPVDPAVHCPRHALAGQLWCRRHAGEAERRGSAT
jgi:hypothetical protein